jgi:sulfatase modifying factor 1
MNAQSRSLLFAITLAAAVANVCLSGQVTIDWVSVGNPRNAADPATGSLYGSVSYSYRIGKYEVTIGQYTEFLNAVAKSDPYGLYNFNMAYQARIAGITRSGSSGSYAYSVMDNGGNSINRPIAFVSWFDAARFANWMHNGQPTGSQGDGTTEAGAYELHGAVSGTAPLVERGATFYIPTENEWYKAAYYNPKLSEERGGYYAYATQSNSAPGNTIGVAANQANYYVGNYPNGTYSVGDGVYSSSHNYLTDVGAFASSGSFYGTFDQNGNVAEWNDLTGAPGSFRGVRGGSWAVPVLSWTDNGDASSEHYEYGFRLASPVAVPEPSTYALGVIGICVIGLRRWR